jgi:hypothetical protein
VKEPKPKRVADDKLFLSARYFHGMYMNQMMKEPEPERLNEPKPKRVADDKLFLSARNFHGMYMNHMMKEPEPERLKEPKPKGLKRPKSKRLRCRHVGCQNKRYSTTTRSGLCRSHDPTGMENISNIILYVAFYQLPDEYPDDIQHELEGTTIVGRDLRMKIGHSSTFVTFLTRMELLQHFICCYDVHYIAFELERDTAEWAETVEYVQIGWESCEMNRINGPI